MLLSSTSHLIPPLAAPNGKVPSTRLLPSILSQSVASFTSVARGVSDHNCSVILPEREDQEAVAKVIPYELWDRVMLGLVLLTLRAKSGGVETDEGVLEGAR